MSGVRLAYQWLRPLLFQLDPERAHHIAHAWLSRVTGTPGLVGHLQRRNLRREWQDGLTQNVWGLPFASPIGLAAGFDKGEILGNSLFALGFGSVEIGSITPRAQAGNPKPRLFRLVRERAVINRMGFNNLGARETARRLEAWKKLGWLGPVGVNLGKNKDVPLAEAATDYMDGARAFRDLADYLVVNVSSPNTPGLRELQEARLLSEILRGVIGAARTSGGKDVPVCVKVDPDLSDEAILKAVDVAIAAGCRGVIATNTTTNRAGLSGGVAQEVGGLSGRPLRERACDVLRIIYRHAGKRITLIGVGGIDSADAAYERIRAGATLVQLYTGLIYEGPDLIRELNAGLVRLLKADGFENIAQARGLDA